MQHHARLLSSARGIGLHEWQKEIVWARWQVRINWRCGDEDSYRLTPNSGVALIGPNALPIGLFGAGANTKFVERCGAACLKWRTACPHRVADKIRPIGGW